MPLYGSARMPFILLAGALLGAAPPAAGQVTNVHATFSGDPRSQVTVSWRTPTSGGTSVEYGLTSALGNTAVGTQLLSGGGIQHHVPLSGLEPGTTYYYQPTGGPLGSFRTAPAGSEHFRFAAVGDVQGWTTVTQAWQDASNFLAQQDLLFWMPLGDLVQFGAQQSQWDAFWGGCPTLSQSVAVMPVIGNHDCYGGLNWWPQLFLDQFRLPDNGNADYQGHWYDFEVGDAHFTVMNSDPHGGPLSLAEAQGLMADWMDQVMGRTDKTWKFAFRHPPLYSTGRHGGENLSPQMSSIWEGHGLNALFNGHTHSLEVTYPIHDGQRVNSWADGTLYYNAPGINSNLAVTGDWFSQFWQTEDDLPLVCIVDVSADEVVVTTYNYQDGSVFHQVTLTDAAALPGDANGDGTVTDADYTIWADHYGSIDATWAMGDFTGDGEVSDADYTLWADHYGETCGTLPEPASALIFALGAAAWLNRKTGRAPT